MFTGIIQDVGRVKGIEVGSSRSLSVEVGEWGKAIQIGDSVAVEGVCLTRASDRDGVLEFDILGETFERSTLGRLKTGDRVNLEKALNMGDPLGGHIVSGHIDGRGTVTAIQEAAQDRIVHIQCSEELRNGMIHKGSIALNGISLTIAELSEEGFTVHIIPHTWKETSLSDRVADDEVNLEVDLVGKFVRQSLREGRDPRNLSWDDLLKS